LKEKHRKRFIQVSAQHSGMLKRALSFPSQRNKLRRESEVLDHPVKSQSQRDPAYRMMTLEWSAVAAIFEYTRLIHFSLWFL
jgi:hypothetical protein